MIKFNQFLNEGENGRLLKPHEIPQWKKYVEDGKSDKLIARELNLSHGHVQSTIARNKEALGLGNKPKGVKRGRHIARNDEIHRVAKEYKATHKDYIKKTTDHLGHTKQTVRKVIAKLRKQGLFENDINEVKSWPPDKIERFHGYIKQGMKHKEIAKKEGYTNPVSVRVMMHRYRKNNLLPKRDYEARNVEIEKLAKEYKNDKATYKSKSWAKKVGKTEFTPPFTGRIAQKVKLSKASVTQILLKRRRKAATNITESFGDVYRAVGNHIATLKDHIGHTKSSALAHSFRYQDFNRAGEIYKDSALHIKDEIDKALKLHSHYHDVHGLFHTHMNEMDRKKAVAAHGLLGKTIKIDNTTPEHLKFLTHPYGSKEHFMWLGEKYQHLYKHSKALGNALYLQRRDELDNEMDKHFLHQSHHVNDPKHWQQVKDMLHNPSMHSDADREAIWKWNMKSP